MSDQLKYNILKIISCNGDLMSIVSKGYAFVQISVFFDELRAKNYMEFEDNILIVTTKGYHFINNYEKTHNVKNESKWILNQEYFWVQPLDKFAIYIPK